MLAIASTIIDAKIYIFYSSVENTIIFKKMIFLLNHILQLAPVFHWREIAYHRMDIVLILVHKIPWIVFYFPRENRVFFPSNLHSTLSALLLFYCLQ